MSRISKAIQRGNTQAFISLPDSDSMIDSWSQSFQFIDQFILQSNRNRFFKVINLTGNYDSDYELANIKVASPNDDTIPHWDRNVTYYADDMIIHNDAIYKTTQTTTPGSSVTPGDSDNSYTVYIDSETKVVFTTRWNQQWTYDSDSDFIPPPPDNTHHPDIVSSPNGIIVVSNIRNNLNNNPVDITPTIPPNDEFYAGSSRYFFIDYLDLGAGMIQISVTRAASFGASTFPLETQDRVYSEINNNAWTDYFHHSSNKILTNYYAPIAADPEGDGVFFRDNDAIEWSALHNQVPLFNPSQLQEPATRVGGNTVFNKTPVFTNSDLTTYTYDRAIFSFFRNDNGRMVFGLRNSLTGEKIE